MRSFRSKSVILGHKNIGEADKLIYFYSENFGKIKVKAIGARRIKSRFTGHLETLNTCDCQLYFGPKNIILTEITSIDNIKNIRNDLNKITIALQIAEFTDKILYENQKIPNLSKLIPDTLKHLETSTKPRLIFTSYIVKLLNDIGLVPDFKDINSKIQTKYLKFFEYLKKEHLNNIEKIHLQKEEEITILDLLTRLVEYQTDRCFNPYFISN